jgi:hypothetical protein
VGSKPLLEDYCWITCKLLIKWTVITTLSLNDLNTSALRNAPINSINLDVFNHDSAINGAINLNEESLTIDSLIRKA